jgi:predicted N-acetyltransferase YhbS
MILYRREIPEDAQQIEQLLDQEFGPDRHKKTAYRLREGVAPLAALCWSAERQGQLIANIRYWPVEIGDAKVPALLLGPIVVAGDYQSLGVGRRLMTDTLDFARTAGHAICLLIGDAPYYSRFGFSRDLTLSLDFPQPVDMKRFLALEFIPGALIGVSGMVRKISVSS